MNDLKHLLEQNRIWAARIKRDDPQFFSKLAEIQTPEYLWIGCSDSRITPDASLSMQPGELFVHRNIANLVIYSDMNCLSVIQFAIEGLKVKHVIVCGHYGCGGVLAAMDDAKFGLIDNWLRHIQDMMRRYELVLDPIVDRNSRLDKLCELNVIEQVVNASETTVVRSAWERGQGVTVHGWVYSLADGIYRDMNVSVESEDELETLRQTMAAQRRGLGAAKQG